LAYVAGQFEELAHHHKPTEIGKTASVYITRSAAQQ
jgi:hypothetical protein